MTTEHFITIGTFLSIFFVLAWLGHRDFQRKEEKERKQKLNDQLEKEKNFKESEIKIKRLLFSYAKENNKLNYVLYDIEEGGKYLKDINPLDSAYIDLIFREEYSDNIFLTLRNFNIHMINLKKSYSRIDKEMPRSKSDSSVGF